MFVLPRLLLHSFHNYLLRACCVSDATLGTRAVAVNKRVTGKLSSGSLRSNALRFLQEGVRSGLPWCPWDKVEHHRVIYNPMRREVIVGLGGRASGGVPRTLTCCTQGIG